MKARAAMSFSKRDGAKITAFSQALTSSPEEEKDAKNNATEK